jgi:hypothetical protein
MTHCPRADYQYLFNLFNFHNGSLNPVRPVS